MYLTGIVQRDRLFDVATRWFANRLEPGDGTFVTEVLVYENLISAPVARGLLRDIFSTLGMGTTCVHRMHRKDEVRRAIIQAATDPTEREQELFDAFAERPEDFFPGTPADVTVLTTENGALSGMIRVKRIRRVADKASRRVANALDRLLREAAKRLAAKRAAEMGTSVDALTPDPERMLEDFTEAEEIFCQAFRHDQLRFEPNDLRIDDVIGSKLVGSAEQLEAIEQAIASHPSVRHIEKEVHRGIYNDVNLLVDLQLPPVGEIVDRMKGRNWEFALGRGLGGATLARDFPGYVESGARTIRVELILTTFHDLVESEFGRAMHEERILSQRNHGTYAGRIARNASYLIEYLLRLAVSPTAEIDDLPIKIWGRYLQETFSAAVWELYGIRHELPMLDSFAPEPFSDAKA